MKANGAKIYANNLSSAVFAPFYSDPAIDKDKFDFR